MMKWYCIDLSYVKLTLKNSTEYRIYKIDIPLIEDPTVKERIEKTYETVQKNMIML